MIAVTASTGHLGRLVIAHLLRRGVPAQEIAALARTPEKAADLAAQGVQVRHADYFQPHTLRAALDGTDRVLLISSSDFYDRAAQHRHAIDAARDAGVALLAYTSLYRADTSTMRLAQDHQATEAYLRDSGVPHTLLRNNWYTENYTSGAAQAIETGALIGSAGTGALNPATRQDYAEAAAAVLATDGHAGAVYELAGDEAITLPGLAAEYARQSGRPVEYRDLTSDAYAAALQSFGLPEAVAATFADADRAIAQGELHADRRDLSTLIGRPTTPLAEAVAAALRG